MARPTSGQIVGPLTAADLLGMAISRPLTQDDLDPVYLQVLFKRVLARRDTQGMIEITAPSYEMQFDVSGGNAALTKAEHAKLERAFDLPKANWKLLGERKVSHNCDFYPLAKVALTGLKRVLRTLRADELEDAFGEQLDLAPQIRADRLALPKRLGVGRRELRFVDRYLDGSLSARTAAHEGGLGPSSALQLLALLDLYEVLDWDELVDTADNETKRDGLAELAEKLTRSNHFEVLQVHWSATDRELEEGIHERLAEFSADSTNGQQAPEACTKIRARIEQAYEVLKDPPRRIAYRNLVYENVDFEAARDLAATRSAALSMRGDAIAARRDELAAAELARSIRPKGHQRPSSTAPRIKPEKDGEDGELA